MANVPSSGEGVATITDTAAILGRTLVGGITEVFLPASSVTIGRSHKRRPTPCFRFSARVIFAIRAGEAEAGTYLLKKAWHVSGEA